MTDKTGNDQKDRELLLVQVIFRHGHRTPYSEIKNLHGSEQSFFDTWNYCPTPITGTQGYQKCTTGQLTLKGQQHMISVGNYLNKLYVQNGFIKSLNDIKIYSTNITRTMFSAVSVLRGLLPNISKHMQHNQLYSYIDITKTSRLSPSSYHCNRYKELMHLYHNNDKNIELFHKDNEINQLKSQILSNLSSSSNHQFPSWTLLKDYMHSYLAHDKVLPKHIFTTEIMNKIKELDMNLIEPWKYNDHVLKVGIGPLVNEVISRFDERSIFPTRRKMYKMFLYSTHDVALIPLYKIFNLPSKYQNNHPNYGEMLRIELYREKSINNNHLTSTKSYGTHFVKVYIDENFIIEYPYQQFQQLINKYRLSPLDQKEWCNTLYHHQTVDEIPNIKWN